MAKRIREHFCGYPREDGQIGVRNQLLLLSGTLYANCVCERLAQLYAGTVAIVHPLGRCQVKHDLRLTFDTLVGHGRNPNAGAVIVVDHFKEEGCTGREIAHEIAKTGKPVETVNIHAEGGVINAVHKCMKLGLEMLREISRKGREKTHVRHLLFGLNCGTSDTTSGLSSNKALGVASDMIISRGGRSIIAELPEQLGAEHVLATHAANGRVARAYLAAVKRFEERLLREGVDIRGTQPTGDNMVGGLSTIEEKSLGGIQKAGKSPIVGVVNYAQAPGKKSGLWVMDTPGHGGESITGIAAGGSQIMVFSTGGGHTINHQLMVTLRVSGNAANFKRMKDTMEIDVSDIFEGTSTKAAGERIYNEVLDCASGRLTKGEILKENNAFAIHRIGISI